MNDILQKITQHKLQEVAQAKQLVSLPILKDQITSLPATKNFLTAITDKINHAQPAIIAEIKKASPSKGIIREDFDPIAIANSYQQANATCLSILTDEHFFQGKDNYLTAVAQVSSLPILRKDFIIDEYQIYQARAIGADAILLIAAILSDQQLVEYVQLAASLNLSVLIEVHDQQELQRAITLPVPLIGINNRNLRTFETSLTTTLELLPQIPKDKIVVTESAIHTKEDVLLMRQHGVNAFLVGEAFMRAKDPGLKLKELFI
jgi:indole-3-glycerol phosphate synthase